MAAPWNVYALLADESDKLCKIADGLYLSSQFAERRQELLVKKGVTHILQVRPANTALAQTTAAARGRRPAHGTSGKQY